MLGVLIGFINIVVLSFSSDLLHKKNMEKKLMKGKDTSKRWKKMGIAFKSPFSIVTKNVLSLFTWNCDHTCEI